ncbi:MAG: 2Fe-2S iron-sulfur cluster binding domain-containing protein [Proteobacteria bacterium]|nr:2Fe-2S iron-sulfur cluster binding domain-containing protein [Pseudomonadota bacterium]
MKKETIEQFDGYQELAREIEVSRKYGVDYAAEDDSVERCLKLLHPKKLKLRVSDIVEETPSTSTLRLVSQDHYLPPFQAGQYVALSVETGGIRTSRPYSISSPPNQTAYYDITVRRVEGGLVSNYLLDQVKRGDTLESSGPGGHFHHNPLFHDDVMVCLAGGSGITPFMSMIRGIVEGGLDRTVHLFYGNKSLDDAIFHQTLIELSRRFENIRYYPVVEEPPAGYEGDVGLITARLIRERLQDPTQKTFYLCGPQAMYDFCTAELKTLDIPGRKIRKEVFGAPLDIRDSPGWPSEVGKDDLFSVAIKDGDTMKAKAGESLTTALEKAGLAIPSLCRSGECSLCRVKILSGRVFQPAGASLRKADRKYGYVHSCVSYPLEDLEIMI